jgi:hypothetical protein
MLEINWAPILVGGAAICSLIIVGAVLFVGLCHRIGWFIVEHGQRAEDVDDAIAALFETPVEKFEFAGQPDYAGLRASVFRAEQAARMQ